MKVYSTEFEETKKFVKPEGDFIFLGGLAELQTKFGLRYIFNAKTKKGEDVIVVSGSKRLYQLLQKLQLKPGTKINLQRQGAGIKTRYQLTVWEGEESEQ
jgi:hypothetical protein